jgi:hypothetical protein
MPSRKHRARIARSRASKMWMESLEQRQLLAPIGGEFSPIMVGEGVVIARRLEDSSSASAPWVSDIPREITAPRRDDDSQGGAEGVVVMIL